MRHAAGNDDYIALGDTARDTSFDAGAPDVGPIAKRGLPRRCGLFQGAAGYERACAFEHVVDLGHVGLVDGRVRRSGLWPENAENADAVSSDVNDAHGPIAVSIAWRILDKGLYLGGGDVCRCEGRLRPCR